MKIWPRQKKEAPGGAGTVVHAGRRSGFFTPPDAAIPVFASGAGRFTEYRLYDTLRRSIPLIDAAIDKIVRLVGDFEVRTQAGDANRALQDFVEGVRVGAGTMSLHSFVSAYLDSLLTYGNAAGEIIPGRGGIEGLYSIPLSRIDVRYGRSPLEARYFAIDEAGAMKEAQYPQFVLFTALNPQPDQVYGTSLLRGLDFVSAVLMTIYRSIGQNFDRVGNVRYAVTYRPGTETMDQAYARERALQIAKEWSEGMSSAAQGQVRDFIAVGDVDIKVIGADNQTLDTQVPVRQLLEQIIAKLSIPPFMLGINWSTTERMSKQQADLLTSELFYYRRLLTPMIKRICNLFLQLSGYGGQTKVLWSAINLQDETEQASARLSNARAMEIERRIGYEPPSEYV